MNENEPVSLDDKLSIMNKEAQYLHQLIKHRKALIKANEIKLKKEKKKMMSNLDKIREDQSHFRCMKSDAKELERQKLSRTLMANLCTAADYPGCPPYVPHMINLLKNIMGNFSVHFYKIYSLDQYFYT